MFDLGGFGGLDIGDADGHGLGCIGWASSQGNIKDSDIIRNFEALP
jgi:hypothetical protein